MRRLGLVAVLATAGALMPGSAAAFQSSMSNCAYVLNGGSKDTRVHANLPIPPELCEGTLHVHVNGNTQAGKTHVGVNTTLTGDPINVQASVP